MASSDEAEQLAASGGPRSSNVGLPAGEGGAAGAGQGRRQRTKEAHQEVQDELAQETKRVTLLDREEAQLKGVKHVSRLLFAFGVADDRKVQMQVEQEFAAWRDKQEGGSEVTGLLLFLGQAALSFLEGPSELLCKGVELFHGLSLDVQAAQEVPLPPSDMRTSSAPGAKSGTEPAPQPRPALISALRVLYFTELHGVRTSTGWCSFVSAAKPSGGAAQNMEEGVAEEVFMTYRKMLTLCLKVRDSAGSETNSDALQNHYRRQADFMPTPDAVNLLLSKNCAGDFFDFAEFQKVFMKPFQLVLNSELLWPMPPALSY